MDNILLLQNLPGFGRTKIRQFLNDNTLFLEDDDYLLYFVKKMTGQSVHFYMDRVKRIKEDCFNLGINIICPVGVDIYDPPLVLYLKGDNSLISNYRKLAVVGTREVSIKGSQSGFRLVERAVKSGYVIISGLARGCDVLAHKTTLRFKGNTVAVLPFGYKPDTAPWLLESGLFVSEYPPYSSIRKYRCIERNRIITGLSNGLYLIESKNGGGSEHSLRYAYKKGIPISYSYGFKRISQYKAEKIVTLDQFDQFLKKCIK